MGGQDLSAAYADGGAAVVGNVLDEAEKIPPAVELSPQWPAPLGVAALHGLTGEVVRAIEPHSESDPAAVLIQFLVAFGNVIGRSAHATVESTKHHCNLFAVVVGETGKARKGTSWDHVRRLFQCVDETWQTPSGLSSGEGLISAVRDPSCMSPGEGHREPADPGVADKRLLVVESEFASVLRVFERDGNRLSALLRQAWDTGALRTMTKCPHVATDAHVSIVGHVTRTELLKYFDSTEAANGLGNRILWACAKRSKLLPEGGCFSDGEREVLAAKIAHAVTRGRTGGRLARTDAARALWRQEYGRLSEGRSGLFGAIVNRAEAQVLRLSVIYALLDCAEAVDVAHLQAALEVWRYCEESARFIFGDAFGDSVTDGILRALRTAGAKGMTRTEIRDFFGRNQSALRIDRALMALAESGYARSTQQQRETPGRPAERWIALR